MVSRSYYQYVPLSKPAALIRMLPRILEAGTGIILDLEDSVQDTLSPENTPLLKAEAREALAFLTERLPAVFSHGVCVRINARDTDEFAKDVKAIAQITQQFPYVRWDAFWLPMVPDAMDIEAGIADLLNAGVQDFEIIPIIETRSAVANLHDICAKASKLRISRLHYGHYDYCLDAGIFPFWRQNSCLFWNHVTQIVETITSHDLTYIHTPFGELDNAELFLQCDSQIAALTHGKVARATLNFAQTQLLASQPLPIPGWESSVVSDDERLSIAQEMVSCFRENRCSRRSFSLNRVEKVFITPHEYKSALQFIAKHQRP